MEVDTLSLNKMGLPVAGDGAIAAHLAALSREIISGTPGRNQIIDQQSPVLASDSYDRDFVACISLAGPAGTNSIIGPRTYDALGNWDTTKYFMAFSEIYANKQILTNTTGLIYKSPWPTWVEGSGDYTMVFYDSGVVIVPASIAYHKGEVTLSGAPTGTVSADGYNVDTGVMRLGANYKSDYYCLESSDSNFITLPIYDPTFDSWASSSQLNAWTKGFTIEGALSRVSATLQGTYAARLQSYGVGAVELSQTVNLTSAISQATFVCVLKMATGVANPYASISISMDGATWNSCCIDGLIETNAVNKWVTLVVESPSTSTSQVHIKIACALGNETSDIQIEGCALIPGSATL